MKIAYLISLISQNIRSWNKSLQLTGRVQLLTKGRMAPESERQFRN